MANYRYKIYNKRGKLVAEATTKREAEKEAKKLGGHYMDQSGLYQLKNPHCVSNPADDPDFQRGFSAGLAAVAAATSYYGKRSNPEPAAPSQASSAYQAGFVAAVQMFGIHLISQSDISRAVISELAGATLVAPPTMPRPTPPKRRRKKPTLSQEPEVSDLAAMVLNVIPPEANSPATKIKRGMIIGAVGAIDAQAGEQLKKGATWSGTIRSLIAAGLVAQDGTKRGAGYYLTGKQAVVIEEPKKPKKPRKPRKPKEPKQPKPSAELSPAVLAQAQAAALAAGVPQGEVDAIVAKAQEMHAKGQHPIAGIVTVGGNTMVTVFPLGTKTLAGIKAALLKSDPGARVFDPVVQENPYIGRGKARFFGAWG